MNWTIENLLENYKHADKIGQMLHYHYNLVDEDDYTKLKGIEIKNRIKKLLEEYDEILGNTEYDNKIKEILIMILDYDYQDILKENRFIMLSINAKFNAYCIVLDNNSKKYYNKLLNNNHTECISIQKNNSMYYFLCLIGIIFATSMYYFNIYSLRI
jgi:hypothetical protein